MAWPWLAKRGTGHENKKAHIAADFFRLVSSVLPYFERRSLSLECDVSHISDDKNSQKKRLNKSFSGKVLNVLPRQLPFTLIINIFRLFLSGVFF